MSHIGRRVCMELLGGMFLFLFLTLCMYVHIHCKNLEPIILLVLRYNTYNIAKLFPFRNSALIVNIHIQLFVQLYAI